MSDSPEIETNPVTAPVEAPSEGTQPSEAETSTPPPEAPAGGEPTIPYSRFREVNERMKWEAGERQRLQQELQSRPLPGQPSYMQPDTTPAPKQENFQTYEEYLDARAEHKATQATARQIQEFTRTQQTQQSQVQMQTRTSQAIQTWNSKVADVAAKDPTFTHRAMELLNNLPTDLGIAICESPVTKELTTHFVQHPEDVFRMASMSPIQAGIELGRLTAKMAVAPAAKVSKMPPPQAPVGSGKTGSKRADEMSTMDVTARLYPYK